MGDPLSPQEAKDRLQSMRDALGMRSAPPEPATPTDPPDSQTVAAESSVAPPEQEPHPGFLDDPTAMSAAMERAAYREQLEEQLRQRDERIDVLEAELARQREVLARMAALLGEALSPTAGESPSEGLAAAPGRAARVPDTDDPEGISPPCFPGTETPGGS